MERQYINREKGIIDFNGRILELANNSKMPLLEKFSMLSISGSNLDEFLMVRLGAILNEIKAESSNKEISGLLPEEEKEYILKEVKILRDNQDKCFNDLKAELASNNIFVCDYKSLTKAEVQEVNKIFITKLKHRLKPINISVSRAASKLSSQDLNMIVLLKGEDKQVCTIALDKIDRMIKLKSARGTILIPSEVIVQENLDKFFNNKEIEYCGVFKILRNANNELVHDNNEYIVERMQRTLEERKDNQPIILEVDSTMPSKLIKKLRKMYNISKECVFTQEHVHIASLYKNMKLPDLKYHKYKNKETDITEYYNIFDYLDDEDLIVHHPYQNYEDTVVKFLEHASEDPSVVMINQTLYRVSSIDSPIVNALCNAAKNGKSVLVVLEIKARFDEKQNIDLINKFQNAGVRVVHGPEEFKTHAKAILIVKETPKGDDFYCHIGTGNYSEKNSKLYTDISYFTKNRKIGRDLDDIFNILSGYSDNFDLKMLSYSPYNLRPKLYEMIDKEIAKGEAGYIRIKVNNLSDKEVIDKLYDAADAGNKIEILCRSSCSMIPYKNIRIKSIIGRFLEHSRIYIFGDRDVFISSADLLSRNLDRRYELFTPVKSGRGKEVIDIFDTSWKDDYNSFEFNADTLTWDRHEGEFNCHEEFFK